ncbi:hypothetical protein AAE478_001375 [Parahypoxylon ruwenzoriense]
MATDMSLMQETADLQLGSTLFGRLPLEIRDMIFAECWVASGPKQHVFLRNDRLTHSPCVLAPDEPDERLDELQRMFRVQESPRRSRTRSLVLDDKWATRFSSPWHEHWRCEEEMKEMTAEENGTNRSCSSPPRRTVFLPLLLTCRRTTSSQLHSLAFSLALPFNTLHQHRLKDSPGPWADLCTALSDLVRFAALREVTLRLGLTSVSVDNGNGAGEGSVDVGSDGQPYAWWQVRERWVLSAVRGMLARRLVVQLPRAEPTHRCPEWARPYNYPDRGDGEGESKGALDVPFRRLERYAALPPMRLRGDGRVEPRMDAPRSPSSSPSSPSFVDGRSRCPAVVEGRDVETRLKKAARGMMELVAALKPA